MIRGVCLAESSAGWSWPGGRLQEQWCPAQLEHRRLPTGAAINPLAFVTYRWVTAASSSESFGNARTEILKILRMYLVLIKFCGSGPWLKQIVPQTFSHVTIGWKRYWWMGLNFPWGHLDLEEFVEAIRVQINAVSGEMGFHLRRLRHDLCVP